MKGLRAAIVALATLRCGDDGSADAASTSGAEASTTSAAASESSTSSTSSSSSGIEPEVDWPHLECDPLVETLCAFPFPNNVFTVGDPSTPTGRRVALEAAAMPVHFGGAVAETLPFARSDGFSTSAAMLAHLPGATGTGLPSPLDIGRSVEIDTPTIVLDAESGELHPHFAEIDAATVDLERRALIIRPVAPLLPARRYIVALRGLVDANGVALPPTPAFAALRDGTPDPSIEDRRGLYEDIFARLEPVAARDELQLAWDFTTASVEDTTAVMIAMRDDALAIVGDEGPEYTLDDVQMDPSPDLALRIEGTMTVPLYLDDPGPGGALVLDDDAQPQQQGFADYPFLVLVPNVDEPAGILYIGHGLLGERFQAEAEYYTAFARENGWVIVATDWIGMADEDVPHIIDIIGTGELHRFHTVVDRLQQGVLNAVLAIRLLAGGLGDDPLLAGAIDPSRVGYIGASQGGILGGVLAAVSPDIQRAVLDVPGQPYNLLLERSVDFTPFLNVLRSGYRDPMDLQLVLVLAQMLWDRAEPAGYTQHLRNDPLPGSGTKDVLLQIAIGDHQVTTLGAHVMARAIGAPNLVPANREVWGLATAEGSADGVGMIEYDFGLPPEPIANVPMEAGEDPHGLVRRLPASIQTRAQFLATGTIETFCDGPCDPE